MLLLGCVAQAPQVSAPVELVPAHNSSPVELAPAHNQYTIASWNLQIYGESKASKDWLVDFYVEKLSKYDVSIIQEIRSASPEPFEKLCLKMQQKGYQCYNSSRAGRSSSKEQYGVFWKNVDIPSFIDYNPDDRWERAPLSFSVFYGNKNISVYTIHTKPDDVANELRALEGVINETPALVVGDLNADCDYYERDESFSNWTWYIEGDTTVSATECAYDRFIVRGGSLLSANIDNFGINKTHSDHYLIWAELG